MPVSLSSRRRTDSHTVVDSKPVTVAAKTYTTDEVTDTKLTNLFDDCTQYMEKNCTAFSRDDFKGTFPEAAEDTTTDAVGISVAEFAYAQDSSVAMPTTGASNPRGASYWPSPRPSRQGSR